LAVVIAVHERPFGGRQTSMVMPSAALIIDAVGRRSTDQPTSRRDRVSTTTQQ